MIDFSITKDAKWIAQRELVWKSLEEEFKEGLRKKELADLKEYFFTGIVPNGRKYPDLALFNWFPIQTAEGWDYVFQCLVKKQQSFEEIFYFSFEPLSHRAFNESQELELWDYFTKNDFNSEIKSRVPVGVDNDFASFLLNYERLGKSIGRAINSWLAGYYGENPKWIKKQNYYFDFVGAFEDSFFDVDNYGDPVSAAAYILKKQMNYIFVFGERFSFDQPVGESGMHSRKCFLSNLRDYLDGMKMPPLMKKTWEEVKSKYGA